MVSQDTKIVPYSAQYKDDFVRLNRAWIEKYFKLEAVDTALFADPQKAVIDIGGFIFCALADGKVEGVCALQKLATPEYGFELSKLAVDPSYRGRGIGEKLCQAAIEKAKSISPKKILIESNTKLVPAITLYKKLGFKEVPAQNVNFERVDIVLELQPKISAMENYYTFNDIARPFASARVSAEAQKFVDALPANFVSAQKAAIESAIAGDSAELEKVRAGRRISSYDLSALEVADVKIPRAGEDGGQLRLRIYSPREISENRPALLYIHGGGWTINSPENCERFCRDFALKNDAVVIAPDYRLAPEHPYPAANYDIKTAYFWIRRNAAAIGIDKDGIFVAGDSAGGHLAISLAIDLRDFAQPSEQVAGVIAIYPATDLRENVQYESRKYFGEKFALNGELMKLYIKAYVPTPEQAARATVINKPLGGLPRTLVLASECDILRSEAAEFAKKLAEAGVKTRYVCRGGATHIYITQKGMDEAYLAALAEVSDFAARRE